jgi:hypothetical protein
MNLHFMNAGQSAGVAAKRSLVSALLLLSLGAATLSAKPIPGNLGNGLDSLAESRTLIKGGKVTAATVKSFGGYATARAQTVSQLAHTDSTGRVLVDIYLNGRVPLVKLQAALKKTFPLLKVTAVDTKYRGVGIIEGYLSVDDAAAIGRTNGVSSVILSPRPYTRVGNYTTQGVMLQRVNQISQIYNAGATKNYDGTGISIAALSDSYSASTTALTPTAATDVSTGDLPGTGNSVNSQPVVVLEDYADGEDEGRAMLQIIHDVAPKARLAFATAYDGQVGFANNIRALAGLTGYTYDESIQQGFKADIITDDVGYFAEPMFSDGVIAQAIDEVAAAGVSYFSSASNDIPINGYQSELRWIANGTGLTATAGNTALTGTNINLANVPTALYQGGFHNFNPNGLDVAQTVNSVSGIYYVMQWNDPYDVVEPTIITPAIFTGSGTIATGATTVSFSVPLTASKQYRIVAAAATGSSVDTTVTIILPDGTTTLLSQDNDIDETVLFFAPVTGTYTVRIGRYSTTVGAFTLAINESTGTQRVTTDLNLLVFNSSGTYQSALSLTTNNVASNQPVELGAFTSTASGRQFVIARSSVPTAPKPATQVRWIMLGNGTAGLGPQEYQSYTAPTTYGHPTAKGANGVAAYSVFRPNIPEYFTSPGPVTIYFDKDNNRLATPEVRLKPDVAAADGGNTTWGYASDSTSDPDTTGKNFFGTSAAAPHAAAIAGLVLQAHGGPGTVTPTQMRSVLQRSAFPHDLDPYSVTGTARATNGGKITITVNSDADTNTNTGQNDPNSWQVSYVGPAGTYVKTLKFNPEGTAATGGNVTGGNFNGYTPDDFLDSTKFGDYPGMVFSTTTKAFTVSSTSGVASASITTALSNAAPAPSTAATQYWTFGLTFADSAFTPGKILKFTVGRLVQHSAVLSAGTTVANATADLLGGGVKLPAGTIIASGMTFSGTLSDGSTFSGSFANRIGTGFSSVDGYGLINAEQAVSLPLQ